MAIWSLTSSQAKSDFPLVTKDNALFVGISFGYAYAGSVAMLTSALEGINMVIAAGHGIAVLSLLVLQRTTIKSRVDKHHSSERIQNLLKIEGSDEKLPKFVSHPERKLLLVCRLILVLFLHQELLVHLHPRL